MFLLIQSSTIIWSAYSNYRREYKNMTLLSLQLLQYFQYWCLVLDDFFRYKMVFLTWSTDSNWPLMSNMASDTHWSCVIGKSEVVVLDTIKVFNSVCRTLYLKNHHINGVLSVIRTITAGVPQKSIVSHIIFLLYKNYLLWSTTNPIYSFGERLFL